MPPKRPRIVPSQTNISVQDVRDYSTPDGASMANEEMRRIKIALQQVQEQQAASVTAQQAAIAQPSPTPDPPKPATETSKYSWTLEAEGYTAYKINNNDVVRFRGRNGINVIQTSRTITISQSLANWIMRGDVGEDTVTPSGVVRFRGLNGVVTRAFPGNPVGTLEIDRPLQVYQRAINIGGEDTTGIDFFNGTNQKPSHKVHQIFFQVQDMGGGVRRITGWYSKDTGGGGGGGGTDWNASDGTTTVNVTDGDTVNWLGANGVTVTLNPIGNNFTISRPLQLQMDGTNVGGQDTVTINFDNATATKPAGYTDQAWHEVIDNGTGVRTIKTWIPSSSSSYTWNIEASSTVGTQAVVSGATVKFSGFNGIVSTRTNDDINLTFNGEYTPGDPAAPGVLMFGELIFNNDDVDVVMGGPKIPRHYGVRKAVDIVHNWNLADPNNFEFQLLDINLSDPIGSPPVQSIVHYRSPLYTMSGEVYQGINQGYPSDLARIIFRNIPHVIAVDSNTVRVHATMSRGKPTEMRFRYMLRKL